VEKCRDVIPKVWWKLGGLALAWFQSEKVVAQISDILWLKPKQGFPFLFLRQEGSYKVKHVGLGFTLHKNLQQFLKQTRFFL
jgi:hypothetical protein